MNRLPSSAIGGKTPLEVWSEKTAADYDLLRVFGCPAYYHVKDDKLDTRGRVRRFQEGNQRVQDLGSNRQEVSFQQGCHIY